MATAKLIDVELMGGSLNVTTLDGQARQQWLEASGLDYTVKTAKVQYQTGRGMVEDPERVVHYRSDNGARVGITGKHFKPVQPSEAIDCFQGLTDYPIQAAGQHGNIIWAQARCPQDIDIAGDRIQQYMTFTTSNAGDASTRVRHDTKRLFCTNQLAGLARGPRGNANLFILRHNRVFNRDDALEHLLITDGQQEMVAEQIENWASNGVSHRAAVNYYAELFAQRDQRGNVTNESGLERVVNKCMESFLHSPGADHIAARGTQWGLINGLTHYVDHVRSERSGSRYQSANFGSGDAIKQKAVRLLNDGTTVEVIETLDVVDDGGRHSADPSFDELLQRPIS